MPVTVRSVAVIGGGLMGRGISARLALRGFDVAVVEPDIPTAALVRDEAVVGRRLATLEGAVTDADIVIEAITEHAPTKRNVWRRVSATARPDAVLATNTSSLSIDDLAREIAIPERFAGMHWFTPADLIPCVEIVRGAETSDETVAALSALAQRAGKAPVVVADSPGFVANRLQFALLAEALRCVEEGVATPAQIDEIVRTSFGPRLALLGPFANADLGGLDVYAEILRVLHDGLGPRYPASSALHDHVADDRLGVKSGAGFADYSPTAAVAVREYRDRALGTLIPMLSRCAETGLRGTPWEGSAWEGSAWSDSAWTDPPAAESPSATAASSSGTPVTTTEGESDDA